MQYPKAVSKTNWIKAIPNKRIDFVERARGGMADTPDLGSGSARIGGSSPLARTNLKSPNICNGSGRMQRLQEPSAVQNGVEGEDPGSSLAG